jgi:phage terminase small subunit
MPARKPKALITRHETAAEAADRAQAEEAMQPGGALPMKPSALKGMKVAGAVWRRMIRMYGEVEGTIVTRLDLDLLTNYCILAEQLAEDDELRKAAFEVYKAAKKAFDLISFDDPALKFSSATKVTASFDAVVKLDGRADRKRDLMFKLQQSLYLTPRARAGAAPKEKEKEKESIDPMDALLGEVTDFVNKGKGTSG